MHYFYPLLISHSSALQVNKDSFGKETFYKSFFLHCEAINQKVQLWSFENELESRILLGLNAPFVW